MPHTLTLRARHLLATSRSATLARRYEQLSKQAQQLCHAARNLRHLIGLLRAVREVQRRKR